MSSQGNWSVSTAFRVDEETEKDRRMTLRHTGSIPSLLLLSQLEVNVDNFHVSARGIRGAQDTAGCTQKQKGGTRGQ